VGYIFTALHYDLYSVWLQGSQMSGIYFCSLKYTYKKLQTTVSVKRTQKQSLGLRLIDWGSLHSKVRDICFFSNTSSQASGPTLSQITGLSSPGVSGWRVRRTTPSTAKVKSTYSCTANTNFFMVWCSFKQRGNFYIYWVVWCSGQQNTFKSASHTHSSLPLPIFLFKGLCFI